MQATLSEIAPLIHGEVVGDKHIKITELSSIDAITPGSLVFAENDASLKLAEDSEAAVVLVTKTALSNKKPLIRVEHPFKAFAQLLAHFYAQPQPKPGIHPTAVIAPNATIGKHVFIGPYVTIDENSHIGDDCIIKGHVNIGQNVTLGAKSTLHPHVTIYDHCQIGNRVSIHANTVIGSDGFGYKFVDGHHMKVPHYGKVIIEDDVEIGANTCIDRGALEDTVLAEDVHLDNQIQIGHNVSIGAHTAIAGASAIAGSTKIGRYCMIGGDVGIAGHLEIADQVVILAKSGVAQSITEKGQYSSGLPVQEAREWFRNVMRLRELDKLAKRVAELEKMCEKKDE